MNINFPSEKAIEDYIWNKLSNDECCPLADEKYDFCLRQKEIKGYGVTDIIKFSVSTDEIIITVLELKNEDIKETHVSQLYRYMTGVKRVARLYRRKIKGLPRIIVRGEIAGPFNRDRGDILWLVEHLDDVDVYSIELDLDDGFKAEQVSEGWYKLDEKRLSYRDVVRDISDALVTAHYVESKIAQMAPPKNVVNMKGDHDA